MGKFDNMISPVVDLILSSCIPDAINNHRFGRMACGRCHELYWFSTGDSGELSHKES